MCVAAKELAVPRAKGKGQIPVETTLIAVKLEGSDRVPEEDAEHAQGEVVVGNVREPKRVRRRHAGA